MPLLLFSEIIKFDNLKKTYYYNQLVNFKTKVILQNPINLNAVGLNTEVNLTKINPYLYSLKIKFKANDKPHKVFLISTNYFKEIDLNALIKPIKLNEYPHNFCKVYATNLKIVNPIASNYDTKNNLLFFTLKCKNCNIKDFNLTYPQKLKIINQNEASIFLIVPKFLKKLNFYYFDLNHSTFKKVFIEIKTKQQTISTQTNINPENKNFFTPLNILILTTIAFVLLIFLIYQKLWIFFIAIILSIPLVYQFIPKGEIILPKNTQIKILPTPQSTTIEIVNTPTKVKILQKNKNYIKIKYQNKIGWVKNDDIK